VIDDRKAAKMAAKIANEVIADLRELGLDAFKKGGYYDISPRVHDIILKRARDALKEA
jgi:hypothetical protein